jgi:hypothetical protein
MAKEESDWFPGLARRAMSLLMVLRRYTGAICILAHIYTDACPHGSMQPNWKGGLMNERKEGVKWLRELGSRIAYERKRRSSRMATVQNTS